MVKRAAMGILDKGKIESIYCHNNGEVDNVGKTLKEHYTEESKIRELIDLGSISVLGEKVAPRIGFLHSFSSPLKGVTVAYDRDRGEPEAPYGTIQVEKGSNIKEIMEKYYNYYKTIPYVYLYVVSENKWIGYYSKAGQRVLIDLDTGKEIREVERRVTREKATDMARILRLNKTIWYRLVARGKEVVLMPEINDTYQERGYEEITLLNWDEMEKRTKQNITQKYIADYIYQIANRN